MVAGKELIAISRDLENPLAKMGLAQKETHFIDATNDVIVSSVLQIFSNGFAVD